MYFDPPFFAACCDIFCNSMTSNSDWVVLVRMFAKMTVFGRWVIVLYFLEHNSFCFGLFLVLSTDNSPQTRLLSNMNQQHKKKSGCDVSFSSFFFGKLTAQYLNNQSSFWYLLLLHQFLSPQEQVQRVCKPQYLLQAGPVPVNVGVDSFSPDFFSWQKWGKPCLPSRSLPVAQWFYQSVAKFVLVWENHQESNNKNKDNEQEKKTVFVSTEKPFWFLKGLELLLCFAWISALCVFCVMFVLVLLVGWEGKTKQRKTKKNLTDFIFRFCFSALNKTQQQTSVWLCKEFDIVTVLLLWGFIDPQTTRICWAYCKILKEIWPL